MPFEAIGAGIGQSVANTILSRSTADKEQKQWRSNQNYLNNQARQNQVDAMSLVKQGYEAAGMSPALAVEGNFTPAQPGSVPLQNKQAPTVDFLSNLSAFAQVKALEAQASNASAAARKANADAQAKENENRNYEAKRKASKDISDAWLNDVIEDKQSSARMVMYAQRLKDVQENYPDLLADDIVNVFGNINNGQKYDSEYQHYLIDKALDYAKWIDSDFINAVKDIPKEQLAQLVQTVANMQKDKELTEAEIENAKKTLKLIEQQTAETKSRKELEDSENLDKLLPKIDGIKGANAGMKSLIKLMTIFFGHK